MGLRASALAAMLVITLLGYFQFPGHTYLQSDTQIYVPILEHLSNPSVLANDIVATKPHVSYTIYDEVSHALRAITSLDFQWVLEGQQFVFRLLGVVGIYLMATSLGLSPRMSLLVTALLHLGATIGGPAVLTVEYEPVPRGFAVPLILLATGLLPHGRFQLAGIVGGVAVLYHPPTVLPLLGATALLVAWPSHQRRERAKMIWPIAAAFGLLLLFARFQAGVSERQIFFGHIDPALEAMQRYRATYNWVSMWPPHWYWQHAVLCGVSVAAFFRLRARMTPPLRLCFTAIPAYGLLSIPLSFIVMESWKWSLMPQLQPARAVLFVTVFATFGAAAAGILAAARGRYWEGWLWFLPVFLVPANVRVIPDFADPLTARRLFLVAGLAALATLASFSEKRPRGSVAWVAAVVLPFFLIPGFGQIQNYPPLHSPELDELSAWAHRSTPEGAVFLFPDVGHGLQPGVFRVRALRAVYVDWKSGGQVNLLKHFAEEWWGRWHTVIPDNYTAPDFPLYAKLHIDYVVLKADHRLTDRSPAYANNEYVVYPVASS
jgi:hypothetical protein